MTQVCVFTSYSCAECYFLSMFSERRRRPSGRADSPADWAPWTIAARPAGRRRWGPGGCAWPDPPERGGRDQREEREAGRAGESTKGRR